MKVVILAGGLGSRFSEETELRPKPMVEIGGYPILWHIMKHFAHHGLNEFVVALGYKGEVIKRYFLEYTRSRGDLTVSLGDGAVRRHGTPSEDWTVHLRETGSETMTGGRLRRLRDTLGDATFMVTYGDGLSNVDLQALLAFHKAHGRLATVTAVRPPARFGVLALEGERVTQFAEKPTAREGWINGGFFVFNPAVLDYIRGDDVHLEGEPLARLASEGQLMAYRHEAFWQSMDTVHERRLLDALWAGESAPWKVWND